MQECATKKREEPVDGVTVWESRSRRGVAYRLVHREGLYAMLIRGVNGELCHLPDIARTEERAISLGRLLSEADVSPINADEVVEDLLARDPSRFL